MRNSKFQNESEYKVYKYPGATIKTNVSAGMVIPSIPNSKDKSMQSKNIVPQQFVSATAVSTFIESGEGIEFGDGTVLMIKGYPLPNNLPDVFSDYTAQHGSPIDKPLVDQTQTFNLTGFPINHETTVTSYGTLQDIQGPCDFELEIELWRERDNFRLIRGVISIYVEDGYYYPAGSRIWFFWWGHLSSSSVEDWLEIDEISENGQYSVALNMSGDVTGSSILPIEYSGIPVTCQYVRHQTLETPNDIHITVDGFGGNGVDYINIYNSTWGTDQFTTRNSPNYHTWYYPDTYWTIGGCTLWSKTLDLSSLPSGIYQFAIRAYDFSGQPSNVDYVNLEVISSTSVELSITSPSYGSWVNGFDLLTVNVTASGSTENIDYINFYISPVQKTDYSYPYSVTYDISSLEEGSHWIQARAYDSADNPLSDTEWGRIYVDNTPPFVSITNISNTSNSITVSVSATDSGSGQNGFIFYLDDSSQTTKYGSSASYTFSGLNEDQQYKVGVRAFDNVLNYSSQVYQYVTTESNRPQDWSWTTAETNAFNGNGAITTLTYLRWNEFIDKVNEFRAYKGLNTIGGKMTSGDRVLTATRFNIVKNGVGSMYATGISDRSAGQDVLGEYFITLKNSLNQIT